MTSIKSRKAPKDLTRGRDIGLDFKIASLEYRVRLVPGYVMNDDVPCLGLTDFDTQSIYVSDVPPPEGRLHTLLHEVMECWLHHCGRPADKETLCDFVALAMCQFISVDRATMLERLDGRTR